MQLGNGGAKLPLPAQVWHGAHASELQGWEPLKGVAVMWT